MAKVKDSYIKSTSRRKAVKTIVGGVTAVAAYHVLPVKWGTPIVEQVFLPVHAATSGTSISDPCSVSITKGDQSTTVHFRVDGFVVPAVSGLPVNIEVTTTGGADAGVAAFPSSLTGLVTDANGQFSQEFGNWAVGTQRVEVTTTVEGAAGSARCAADVPRKTAASEPDPVTYNIELRGISVFCNIGPDIATITQVNGIVEASDGSNMDGVQINVEIGNESDTVLANGGTFQWNGAVNGNVPVPVRVSFTDAATYGTVYSDQDVGCEEGPPR